MKILILGAGQVGSTIATHLAREEANDITVVDRNPDLLRELQDRLDIRTVLGHAAHPDILARAGAAEAHMVIAVTDNDETNMVACHICYTRWQTTTKIARVRAAEYLADADDPDKKLFRNEVIAVDFPISPEKLVKDHIRRLIQYQGALQVLDFADGKVRLVGVRAKHGGPLLGKALRTLREHLPDVDARVAAIYRKGQAIIPVGDTVIEADDELFFIAARQDIRTVISELRKLDRPARKVMIAGGGHIGVQLAKHLEQTHEVKLIERDRKRAAEVSELLERAVVLAGDAADEDLLREEGIENVDVFCAITNDEKTNILSALLAKQLGAARVMALINRPSFVELVHESPIDIALSPQQITISAVLRYLRGGNVAAVHTLRRGAAEAIEAIASGDASTSQVIGRAIQDVPLPAGTTIGAIVRGDEVIMGHHDIVIQAQDHVILFLVDRRNIPAIEALFRTDASLA
jgi:trk system potassium uptake protein TrkA